MDKDIEKKILTCVDIAKQHIILAPLRIETDYAGNIFSYYISLYFGESSFYYKESGEIAYNIKKGLIAETLLKYWSTFKSVNDMLERVNDIKSMLIKDIEGSFEIGEFPVHPVYSESDKAIALRNIGEILAKKEENELIKRMTDAFKDLDNCLKRKFGFALGSKPAQLI